MVNDVGIDIDGILNSFTAFQSNRNNIDEHKNYAVLQNYGALSDGKIPVFFCKMNWSGYERYDLRVWKDDMTPTRKGITFTESEIAKLYDALKNYDLANIGRNYRYTYKSDKLTARIFESIHIIDSYSIKDVKWNKEVVVVSWRRKPKIEFRHWSEDYEKCGKGIGLSVEEVMKFLELYSKNWTIL